MTQPKRPWRLRPARLSDLDALETFIAAYTADGTLLPRTRENLVKHLREFRVAVADGQLIGCGALQIWDESLAEIRSVVVAPGWRGQGVGRHIVQALLTDARRLQLHRLGLLTRRPDFFGALGFTVVDKAVFPQKVWNDCRHCPRQDACDEIAMERVLAAHKPAADALVVYPAWVIEPGAVVVDAGESSLATTRKAK